MAHTRAKGLFILGQHPFELIYGSEGAAAATEWLDLAAPPMTAEEARANPGVLAECEVIMSGWNGPHMDAEFMAHARKLKLFLYGAGTIRGNVTDAMWDAGVRVCTAVYANGVPVTEYTLATILLGLKRFWQQADVYRGVLPREAVHVAGAYGSTVGLVSLGTIGRRVCELLKPFDVKIIAYDPFIKEEDAARLGVELVSLEEIFTRSDVVSLHIPNLEETRGMVTGAHLASMKPGAVLINTARGAVVREDEMAQVLAARPDLYAVLDVTIRENPEADAPLLRLPNVIRTPHIAGSQAGECRRMGRLMLDELGRYMRGEALQYEVTRERAAIMA